MDLSVSNIERSRIVSYICQNSESVMAKLHIKDIRKHKFSIDEKRPNPFAADLQNAVASLSSELYTKDIHFLMELIQVSLSLSLLCEVCLFCVIKFALF